MKILGHRGYGVTDVDIARVSELSAQGYISETQCEAFLKAQQQKNRESYPENSLAAFHHALDQGADGFELDVFLSADTIPVVTHAAVLEEHVKQADAASLGKVGDHTAEVLKRLSIGGNQTIPTLTEALDVASQHHKPVTVNIELKGHDTAEATADIVRQHAINNEAVIFSSFSLSLLEILNRYAPEMKCGMLFDLSTIPLHRIHPQMGSYLHPDAETLKDVRDRLAPHSLHPNLADVTPEFLDIVADIYGGNLPEIYAWSLCEPLPEDNPYLDGFLTLAAQYPNLHLITDYPKEVRTRGI